LESDSAKGNATVDAQAGRSRFGPLLGVNLSKIIRPCIMRPGILIVDNDLNSHRLLKPMIQAGGFDVFSVMSGAEAINLILTQFPDLILLDLALPDMDGKEVIREVRLVSHVPIVIISARSREAEKIAALDFGADDYVVKPPAIGELLARIRAILRYRESRQSARCSRGDTELIVDTVTRIANLRGQPLKLTRKEFLLLKILTQDSERIFTHAELLQKIWGSSRAANAQYLRVLIGRVRQKIELDPARPKLLITEPGIGYRVFNPAHPSRSPAEI
jgi:two-component system, OmpR family, KDP operon response regulator KdpE